jgi:type VI secretion system secreted protein VgrG
METALLQAAAWQETLTSREALQAQVDLIANMGPQPKGKLGGDAGRQNTFKTPNRSRDEDTAEPMTNLMRSLH